MGRKVKPSALNINKKNEMSPADRKMIIVKLVLRNARTIINFNTLDSEEISTRDFLKLKVYQSSALHDISAMIFDKAIDTTETCMLFARLCRAQVKDEEVNTSADNSLFRNAMLTRAKEFFKTEMEDIPIKEMKGKLSVEPNTEQRALIIREMVKVQICSRKRRIGNTKFIAHLHLHDVVSGDFIAEYASELLESVRNPVDDPENPDNNMIDESAVECAAILLEIIGKSMAERNERFAIPSELVSLADAEMLRKKPFPFKDIFSCLQVALPMVNVRVGERILKLMALRDSGWTHKKSTDDVPNDKDEPSAEETTVEDVQKLKEALRKEQEVNEKLLTMMKKQQALMEKIMAKRNKSTDNLEEQVKELDKKIRRMEVKK